MMKEKIVHQSQVSFRLILFLLLTVFLFLSGCGGGGGGGDDGKGTVVIMVNRSDASFSLDGPGGHVDTSSHPLGMDNSMSVSNLPPGNYTVTFNNIGECMNAPAQDSGLLEAGQVLTLKGDYSGCGPGTIKVYTNNKDASFTITGAEQNFNGNSLDWETTVAPEGSYTITFHSLLDHDTPPASTKTLTGGQVLIFTGNYFSDEIPAQAGSIKVTSNHPGAAYRISGPADYVGSGISSELENVPLGTYKVTFEAIEGFKTPAAQTKTVSANETISFNGDYTRNCKDADGDGYYAQSGCGTAVDCNDNDPDIHPGAAELCNDGIDNDCDGDVDDGDSDCVCTDADGDGYYAKSGCGTAVDCNDNDADVNPGAAELCDDEKDNDCDGDIDEGCDIVCTDADGDGYYAESGCGAAVDCNDNDAAVHPGAVEDCDDGIDNDCNGAVDDADGSCGGGGTGEYFENFESGWNGWSADKGVWEVGTPSVVGPEACYSGSQCAGTDLDANYPPTTDSRFISPSIQLMSVSNMEEIHLTFWQYFSYGSGDSGYVQISEYDSTEKKWSNWTTISNAITESFTDWTLMDVDLTNYAGKKVKIAFYHTADNWAGAGESTGWYIDAVSVSHAERLVTPSNSIALNENFESGYNGWSADKGVWEVGTPSEVGPDNCHSGTQCAGTDLNANYPPTTDSHFISPSIQLMSVNNVEEIHLTFWHYFSYGSGDSGYVQISEYDDTAKQWSNWTTVSNTITESFTDWTLMDIDITKYAGKKVKIAFYHTADNWAGAGESTGWYIDDVLIQLYK